jgi:hypothetical protein
LTTGPDVGAVFGSQFTNSGFNAFVTGLSPGTYVMTASAESTVSGTFNQARSVTVTIPSPSPAMSLDVPSNNAVVGPSFTLAGWAIDRGAPSGTGVDQIAVWALPSAGGSAVNLGLAAYGQARSDIGQAFGGQFTNAGYSLTISSLPPGAYDIRASAHSLVAGAFNQERWVHVTVGSSASNPLMVVDLPANDSTVGTTLSIAGWGIDRGATSGTGVDAVVVWAFPINGTPFPLGATNYGGVRNDIANAFGAQFRNSGFTLNLPSPAPGTYDLRLSLHSTVANTYNLERWTRVTVSATGSNPRMFVDQPTSGATIGQPFTLSGWAVDLGAPSGTGVDAIEVWAFPTNGSQPFRVGAASYGSARPDIGSAFGTAFTNSGYALSVSNLPAHGTYDLRVSARSTVTGSFNQEQWIRITIP